MNEKRKYSFQELKDMAEMYKSQQVQEQKEADRAKLIESAPMLLQALEIALKLIDNYEQTIRQISLTIDMDRVIDRSNDIDFMKQLINRIRE